MAFGFSNLSPSNLLEKVVDTVYKAAIKHVDFQNLSQLTRKRCLYFQMPNTSKAFGTTTSMHGEQLKEENFHLLNGTSVKAQFMRSSKDQFVKAFDGLKVLKLLYEQGKDMERQFSVYLLLPDSRDGLPALVERICSEPSFLHSHRPKTSRSWC